MKVEYSQEQDKIDSTAVDSIVGTTKVIGENSSKDSGYEGSAVEALKNVYDLTVINETCTVTDKGTSQSTKSNIAYYLEYAQSEAYNAWLNYVLSNPEDNVELFNTVASASSDGTLTGGYKYPGADGVTDTSLFENVKADASKVYKVLHEYVKALNTEFGEED